MVSFRHPKILAAVFCALAFLSCDIINPKEPIPAYVYLDTSFVETDYANQGTNNHRIYDCWITYESNLIGAFSLPALV
ncbi:MAG: hypothetical protein KDC92_15600, partial [Bacteroidetes bacterium]|nr:hypothetical protein [Bacteroidota bacterium]